MMMADVPPIPKPSGGDLGGDIAALEQKLATLLAHTRALRVANESLRQELTAANARNQNLAGRVAEAKQRLDALLARLPGTTA